MDEKLRANVVHLVILAVLLAGLLGVLIFTGLLGCNAVPGGCEIYYRFVKGGQPNILVVYGDSGLGDPDRLVEVLNGRDLVRAQARSMGIEKLNYVNVREFDLMIVERAKKICSDKLKLFEFYVNSGGRLVWTGDAGTELCSGEGGGGRYGQNDTYLLESERVPGGKAIVLGPWARKDSNNQVSFDEFLGAQYKGNYCDFTECRKGEDAGRIEITNSDHKLSYGLSPSIPFRGNFAVVEQLKEGSRLVAVLDYGAKLLGKGTGQPWLEAGKTYNFGKDLPFIISSQVGERVAYYAAPIESFVSPEQPQKYNALIEQMYYGMLYQ